jgi:hypothetical protein
LAWFNRSLGVDTIKPPGRAGPSVTPASNR